MSDLIDIKKTIEQMNQQITGVNSTLASYAQEVRKNPVLLQKQTAQLKDKLQEVLKQPEKVVEKFLANFNQKALPLLNRDPHHIGENLILASILEKEIPDFEEQRLVSGILRKRLSAGIPLQVDAAICYIKEQKYGRDKSCYPLSPSDFKIDSPHNTYLYAGWPKGPIGNPGLRSIQAATNPAPSDYWYYLSDPRTKKTIFSKTFEDHALKKARYLRP